MSTILDRTAPTVEPSQYGRRPLSIAMLAPPWIAVPPSGYGGVETVVADDAEPERRRRSLESVEQRVKQLHGSIEVDAENAGTQVKVTLPSYATRR